MPAIDGLLASLALEAVGEGAYRATNIESPNPVVYGGQLLAQSVIAALADVDDKRVKTIHTVFARGGNPAAPLEIGVDAMHSGRAFASRTVTITQGESVCTRSQVLLTADEPDFIHHADPSPGLTPPDDGARDGGDSEAFEVRVVADVDVSDPDLVGPPDLDVWVRVPEAPDDPAVDQALLAYISDGFLIGTAMRPHEGVGQAQAHVTVATSVVSHTLTFHESFSMRDWLLLSHHSSHAGAGRSYGRADVYASDGRLVASYVQDAMIRPASARSTGS